MVTALRGEKAGTLIISNPLLNVSQKLDVNEYGSVHNVALFADDILVFIKKPSFHPDSYALLTEVQISIRIQNER